MAFHESQKKILVATDITGDVPPWNAAGARSWFFSSAIYIYSFLVAGQRGSAGAVMPGLFFSNAWCCLTASIIL